MDRLAQEREVVARIMETDDTLARWVIKWSLQQTLYRTLEDGTQVPAARVDKMNWNRAFMKEEAYIPLILCAWVRTDFPGTKGPGLWVESLVTPELLLDTSLPIGFATRKLAPQVLSLIKHGIAIDALKRRIHYDSTRYPVSPQDLSTHLN